MKQHPSLELLVAEFAQWRASKVSKAAPIPPHLRQQAVALIQHYSQSQISSALSVSGSQLQQWRAAQAPAAALPLFIPVHCNEQDDEPVPDKVTALVTLAHGHQIRLCGAVSPALLAVLLRELAL